MKQVTFKEKYPIWTIEFKKDEIKQKSVSEILEYFKTKIDAHPVATFIATFDHYTHTRSLSEHSINPDIKDIQNIIFCFGKEIPVSKVAAVRPRSIGVCEMPDSFIIEFMEAPNETANSFMEEWAKSLKV